KFIYKNVILYSTEINKNKHKISLNNYGRNKRHCIFPLFMINLFSMNWMQGGILMSRKCVITVRKTGTGNHRSHALNANKSKWKSNVQKVRMMIDGKPKRVYVSAHALKSGKVQRV